MERPRCTHEYRIEALVCEKRSTSPISSKAPAARQGSLQNPEQPEILACREEFVRGYEYPLDSIVPRAIMCLCDQTMGLERLHPANH